MPQRGGFESPGKSTFGFVSTSVKVILECFQFNLQKTLRLCMFVSRPIFVFLNSKEKYLKNVTLFSGEGRFKEGAFLAVF